MIWDILFSRTYPSLSGYVRPPHERLITFEKEYSLTEPFQAVVSENFASPPPNAEKHEKKIAEKKLISRIFQQFSPNVPIFPILFIREKKHLTQNPVFQF